MRVAEQPHRVIADDFVALRTVRREKAAAVLEIEDGLNSARNVPSEKRDGAGRGDRGQNAVAQPFIPDRLLKRRRERCRKGTPQELACVKEGKCSLLLRQFGACRISGVADLRHPGRRKIAPLLRAIMHAAQDQGIGEPGYT